MKKHIVQWIGAFIISVLICNSVLWFYHRPTGWIDRDCSSTTSIWDPNTSMVWGKEGYGRHQVDSKGYLNDNLRLSKEYTLVIGASYTQGKEVDAGKRYTDLLNQMLGARDELKVYNVSQDAFFFPDIVKCFDAINKEFPYAKNIIIEVSDTYFAIEKLQDALIQRTYDYRQDGDKIYNALSLKKIILMKIKEILPIVSCLKEQLNLAKIHYADEMDTQEEQVKIERSTYIEELSKALMVLREQYDGRLIIMFHPKVEINEECGELKVLETETDKIFEEQCMIKNIEFLNVSEAIVDEYKKEYSVPYGFSNTVMGSGHLNEIGHDIIAKEIYKLLIEENK